MNEDKLQLPQHAGIRQVLRYGGLLVLGVGALLTLIGIGSFFASFGSFEPPRFFWCAFLGMPLLFVGGVMTLFGFLGAIQRYAVGEAAPVAKDVVNYMGENTQPGVKAIAKAAAEGVQEGFKDQQAPKE